jgi:hypothetical protein
LQPTTANAIASRQPRGARQRCLVTEEGLHIARGIVAQCAPLIWRTTLSRTSTPHARPATGTRSL